MAISTVRQSNRMPEIVAAARHIIATEGPASFSLRRVANCVDIKLASLQYHVPTKADLLRAVVDDNLERYKAQLLRLKYEVEGEDPVKYFERAIKWFLDKQRKGWEEIQIFEVQFWAMAFIDEDAGGALEEYLLLYRKFFADLLKNINPALTDREALRRGAILSVMIDGQILLAGLGRTIYPEFKGLIKETTDIALAIAKKPA